ncbi:MAG: serine/threonine protein kinase [Trichocoleus desertorum ATA4-8-CV12]|jgi:serine/threonine protein kinase|nr:serine/threonine protein kinase [Trichocoleus desertorum ATA4-8-CV12]
MQVGKVLQGRYQLQQPLGHNTSHQNAARQTWLALDHSPCQIAAQPTASATGTPQPVVIKLLAFSPQLQWDEWKLFEREAQILQQLDHPRVPRCHAQFSLEPVAGVAWCALVQDHIPGTSLQQLLDRGYRFSETEVRQIATEVLEILADLHRLCPPVLHRDLKPSNLILTPEQQIYVVDFGAGQNQAIATGGSFTVVGTYGYTPMEQFGGRTVPASDLYALGATLVHLLTGIDPADLPQRHLQLQWHAHAPSNLSPRLAGWIDTLIAPAVEQRFSSAEQALAAIAHPVAHPVTYPVAAVVGVESNSIDGRANGQANGQAIAPQPAHSQIQVHQSPDTLHIKIPAPQGAWSTSARLGGKLLLTTGMLSLPIWLAVLAIVPLTPLAVFPESMMPLVICTPFLLFLHAFFLAGLGVFSGWGQEMVQVLQLLQGQHSLSLNQHCVAIESRFGGVTYRGQHEFIRNIEQVRTASLGRIALQAIGKTHLFGWGLAAAEQEWLVQEMQAWLQAHGSATILSAESQER